MTTLSQEKESLFWAAASLAVYAGLFFIFYPPVFAIRDEGIYMAIASLIKRGTLYLDQTSVPLMMGADVGGHRVPLYPPGNSLLLLPFLQLGWQKVFLCGFMLHVVGVFLVRRLARIFNVENPLAVPLYVFFPAFLFYSRTLMSDMPSMVLFLTAAVFYFQPGKSKLWAGIFLGVSLFFRVSNAILFVPFGLGLLVSLFKTRSFKDVLLFSLGALPFIVGAAVYNAFFFGGPFEAGYAEIYSGVKNFSPQFLPGNLKHYFLSLNFMYPLMFLVFLSVPDFRRVEFYALIAVLFIFFGFYYFHDSFPGLVATLSLGTRFFFPLIPFLILAYSAFLWSFALRLPVHARYAVVAVFMLGLWLMGCVVVTRHQIALKKQDYLKRAVYHTTHDNDVVIYDAAASELIQEAWGKRRYFFDEELKEETLLQALQSGAAVHWVRRPPYMSQPAPGVLASGKIMLRPEGQNADLQIMRVYLSESRPEAQK